MIKAVLCDVYQTLIHGERVDDREPHLRRVTESYDLEWPEDKSLSDKLDECIRDKHAESHSPHPEVDIREIWVELFPSLNDPEAFAYDTEQAIHRVSVMPGALEALKSYNQSGIRLGIVSNAQAYTRRLLAELFGEVYDYFDPTLMAFSYEHGIAKPDRRLFESAVKPLYDEGIKPHEILVVGDSMQNDIEPAKSLGLQTNHFKSWTTESIV